MKYLIKKAIILLAMRKRKRNYKFDEEDSVNFNNSYYFTARSRNEESLFFRVGYRSNGEKEVWAVFVDKNGVEYVNKGQSAMATPSRFCYTGEDFEINGEFMSFTPEYEFTRDSDPIIFANLLAKLKWKKGFDEGFKKLQQTHLEQIGRVTAEIRIDGITTDFLGYGFRDHSWGRRVWTDMDSHKWFIARFDDERYLCASYVNGLTAGYYIKMGRIYNVINIKYENDNKTFTVTARKGKSLIEVVVQYTIKHSFPFDFQYKSYHIDECISEFVIDGVKGYGITEFGENKDKLKDPNSIWRYMY
ncbi:MAG: hypothetical protein LBL13_04635 [Bacteroidales bacterium]|jgi:hypothetical protein|nr:hypothetical protein [Bacteroidales bacterium]